MSDTLSLKIGDEFPSFHAFQDAFSSFCSENAVSTYIWDSQKIATARKRGIKKSMKEELVYYSIKFGCVKGGKSFKAKGKGIRDTRTLKDGCSFQISIRINENGDMLRVISFNPSHNHELNRELYNHLPQQRKLTTEERAMVIDSLVLGGNKKLIQGKLMRDTNKVVVLKDLTNIEQKNKQSGSGNNLEAMVKKLHEKYKCEVKVLSDEDSNFCGIFFQDQEMKNVFDAYPELVCLDSTYKLTNLRFPLFIMLVEDGLGLSEICGTALLRQEDEVSLRWMCESFKKENPKSLKIRAFMTDKDITERQVLTDLFENASLLICLFHTLRTFRREVSVIKMGITEGQAQTYLDIFQKMAYAKNPADYEIEKNNLLAVAPRQVREYFLTSWDPIRDEWVHNEKSMNGNLLNSTNNRLESINGKLKSVIKKFSSLDNFIDGFFSILTSLRVERDNIASRILNTRKVKPFTSLTMSRYSREVTPYAFSFLEQQYILYLTHMDREVSKINDATFQIPSSEGILITTGESCSCLFHGAMSLPCRHIFLARSLLRLEEFDSKLCSQRWKMSYFSKNARVMAESSPSFSGTRTSKPVALDVAAKVTVGDTVQKRFTQARVLTDQIANIVSESTGNDFTDRMEFLRNMCFTLTSSSETPVCVLASEQSPPSRNCPPDSSTKNAGVSSCTITSPIDLSVIPLSSTSTVVTVPAFPSTVPSLPSPDVSSPNISLSSSSTITVNSLPTVTDITSLKLPPPRIPKGRPKGLEKTAIGLNRKRKRDNNKVLPFSKLHISEKKIRVLSWFAGKQKAIYAVNEGSKVGLHDLIEADTQNLLLCSQDDQVDVKIIRPYTEIDAYKKILVDVTSQSDKDLCCAICDHPVDDDVIQCASCLSHLHLQCIDKHTKPKVRSWFCDSCTTSCTTSKVGKRSLRTIAREIHSESEESEDELSPNESFVNQVRQMHEDGLLAGWLQMSHDPTKNPLLTCLKNGVVQAVELLTCMDEYPQFYQDMEKAGKMHGCYTFLCDFTQKHYQNELYDSPSLLVSQLQFLQIAIMHTID